MRKVIEIKGDYVDYEIEKGKTMIGHRLVCHVDMSEFNANKKIVLKDEHNRDIKIMYLPPTAYVSINFYED